MHREVLTVVLPVVRSSTGVVLGDERDQRFPGCRGQPQQLGESMAGGAVVTAAVSMAISPRGSTSIGHASNANAVSYHMLQNMIPSLSSLTY